jgi:SAM-dependent methyltransferase
MGFDELHKLASAFQGAALFHSALELGVFNLLGRGPKSATQIAEALALDARATGVALNALVSMGILEKDGDNYANGDDTAAYLVEDAPAYRGAILKHMKNTWQDWAELSDTWRTGTARCSRKEGSIPKDPEQIKNFIVGMENITREIAPMLAERLPLEGCKSILDLGGGPGNYVLEFARRCPEAKIVHFDLESTSALARGFIEGKPGSERIELMVGDFMVDDLGEGYDFIWLSQVLHMFGEEDARELVARAAGALAVGGKLCVHEHFLNEDKVSPPSATIFGVHMLVATPGGRSYSFGEVQGWCTAAGLKAIERIDYGGYTRVLAVEKR